MRSQLKERLNRSMSPVFDYAEVEFFLARQNGSVVGRIAAIKNENHIIFHDERVGFFGFFECVQDQRVADALFTKAADWLKSRYLHVMRGSHELLDQRRVWTTHRRIRLLTGNHDVVQFTVLQRSR